MDKKQNAFSVKKIASMLSAISMLGLLGASTTVLAAHLPAPSNLTCTNDGTDVTADWDDVIGAKQYGVEFIATYPDGTVQEFDFSVKGETNSFFMTGLSTFDIDTDGDTIPDTSPDTLEVTAKSLHPGKGEGPQNSAKTDPVDCGV